MWFYDTVMWSLSGLCGLLFHLRGEDNAKNKKYKLLLSLERNVMWSNVNGNQILFF